VQPHATHQFWSHFIKFTFFMPCYSRLLYKHGSVIRVLASGTSVTWGAHLDSRHRRRWLERSVRFRLIFCLVVNFKSCQSISIDLFTFLLVRSKLRQILRQSHKHSCSVYSRHACIKLSSYFHVARRPSCCPVVYRLVPFYTTAAPRIKTNVVSVHW
jgi:hypothetical protein